MSDSNVATRLRFFSARAGLSQSRVAKLLTKKLGITPRAVYFWFQGAKRPRHEHLEGFVDLCGTDIPTFYGPIKEPRARRKKVA